MNLAKCEWEHTKYAYLRLQKTYLTQIKSSAQRLKVYCLI